MVTEISRTEYEEKQRKENEETALVVDTVKARILRGCQEQSNEPLSLVVDKVNTKEGRNQNKRFLLLRPRRGLARIFPCLATGPVVCTFVINVGYKQLTVRMQETSFRPALDSVCKELEKEFNLERVLLLRP